MNNAWGRKVAWVAVVAALSLLTYGCAAKKAEEPGPTPIVEEVGKSVRMTPTTGNTMGKGTVDPEHVGVSISWNKHNHVRWTNDTNVDQTIRFNLADWIFVEPYSAAIVVPAGGRSEWFTVKEDAATGVPHTYGIDPLITPPAEPTVTAEP